MLGSSARIASQLHAVLGPTNTGKTHGCILRMLEHDTGMFGLPLRLLAREVYDRVCGLAGVDATALITGEERRIPAHPRYWVCTVEAMPTSLEVEFLAVDEIQLITHPHRGHVFTDRLLHARGTHETWFLGSASVRPLLEQLIPTATFKSQPRFSRLSFAGNSSLGGVPPRSAIVSFSAHGVYELAERVRARKGGAAVVLGALSPRTRNAQVAMYQAGEVDYLVATDAIGMGLNMDIHHVALAGTRKFDGKESRELHLSELAQVAGRAGRYLTDGTFGTLDPAPHLSPALALKIENHMIPLERHAWFRSSKLDFSSIDALQNSMKLKPAAACLRLMATAEDAQVLELAARNPKVRALAVTPERLELLWALCQIPDYRKLLPEIHCDLVTSIYDELTAGNGILEEDWLAQRIHRLDDTTGDIDALLGRISFVRTWTYVVNHRQWVRRSRYWQERTASIEDALSDALHERLIQRFVEFTRRTVALTPAQQSAGASRAKQASAAHAQRSVAPTAGPFAQLLALKLQLEQQAAPLEVLEELPAIATAPSERFQVSLEGVVSYQQQTVARLIPGGSLLTPGFRLEDPAAPGAVRAALERKVREVLSLYCGRLLARLQETSDDKASVRGILYQLRTSLGTVRTSQISGLLAALSDSERADLTARGIAIGRQCVYLRDVLRPEQIRQRLLLARLHEGAERLPAALDPSRVSFEREARWASAAALHIGYVAAGPRWVRCDALERALELAFTGNTDEAERVRALSRILGCPRTQVGAILRDWLGRPQLRQLQ